MKTTSTKTISNTSSNTEEPGMVAPTIPDAIFDEDHEGLLPLTMLGKPLRVEFGGWFAIRPGHTYQLLLNDLLVGDIKTITSEKPGDLLFLNIPAEYLTEGVHAVAYRATNNNNGVHADSTRVRLEIVMTSPGRPKLAPIKFPEDIDCGLTSEELTAMGDKLIAEVGSYAGIYQHDVIRTFWGDTEGPGAVVVKSHDGIDRIQVVCTRDFLQSLGDFDGLVTYTVTDRAGNTSALSLGAHIKLLVNAPLAGFKNLTSSNKVSPVYYHSNVVDITLRLQDALTTSK